MRIKTIATLGPSSLDYKILKQMVNFGVRIFRLNFSHAPAEKFVSPVQMIKKLETETGIPLTIMGDLSGPKIRIGQVENSPVPIHTGSQILLGLPEFKANYPTETFVPLDLPEVIKGLQTGMTITISDGIPRFQVIEIIKPNRLYRLEAQNNGLLTSNKGITFPEKKIDLPAFTEKDKKDLNEGLEIGIDAFAQSFVQNKQDMVDIKTEIKRHGLRVPVIAKLERASGIDNLEEILKLADGIMVARGDLGLECPLPSLPVIQKRLIRACRHAQKPSIVATQMLLSMVKNPLPTRAEVTDVANAILDGADCVMLSEETAVGEHPVEAVKIINEIAGHAEDYFLERLQGPYRPKIEKNPGKYLAYSACLLADNTDSRALVCHSTSGLTARLLSSRRPAQPIYALTPEERVIKHLNFYWGVRPCRSDTKLVNHLDRVEKFIQNSSKFQKGDSLVLTAGQPTPGQTQSQTNQIKIYYK